MVTPQSIAKSQRPSFSCPDCGLPTHCSEKHYELGLEHHKKYCSLLREINEDEHDLRSGRKFPEFKFPGPSFVEAATNLASWDTFFVTRNFKSIDDERSVRHVSKLLTYPLTIGSILHPFGPHRPGTTGLTLEGSKSLAALQYTMEKEEPAPKGSVEGKIKQQIRIFILGARAEAQLPPYSYLQLCYLFPNVAFQIYFVGPEALPPSGVPEKVVFNSHLSFNYCTGLFHEVYHQAVPFDPYHDVFFMFSPGISYPFTQQLWHQTLNLLLETKCAIFTSGYDEVDLKNDSEALEKNFGKEMDWLLKPTLNPFRSLKADLNLQDVRMTLNANHGIMGIRGKRYEVRPN
ncbi:translational activator for mitochondrial COX1 [Entomophthora muscae]|uniref:Translational activator for mitochondrial COX1 n=1 Tax=Entomophthora muscae TaxID=34485 RepID=A0ACC2S0Z6_9FUNG|nr:translational activator for mitochondrial COX1 [Entomophthora muscae]